MVAKKLTDRNVVANQGFPLTEYKDKPFIISFQYKLENGYTFKNLGYKQLKQFQNFLDKVSQMYITQVDKTFGRPPDRDDEFNGLKVVHYGISDKFRIHGVFETDSFKLLRIDPNHRFHE